MYYNKNSLKKSNVLKICLILQFEKQAFRCGLNSSDATSTVKNCNERKN